MTRATVNDPHPPFVEDVGHFFPIKDETINYLILYTKKVGKQYDNAVEPSS